jgi:hypothetical protein
MIKLIDDLEDGELEKRCSQADLEQLNRFLADLSMRGILPNALEEACVLEQDIDELLYGDDGVFEYAVSFGQDRDYVIVPTVFYGHGEMILCKSWFHKKWDQTKKFVKKHRKAIIIGAAVVVSTVIVVGVVVAASTVGAAAVGAVASGSDTEEDEQESTPSIPSVVAIESERSYCYIQGGCGKRRPSTRPGKCCVRRKCQKSRGAFSPLYIRRDF